MNSVRFRTFGTIASAEGLARYEVGVLHLEYQLFDGLLGVLKSGVKHLDIPLTDLASIKLERGWLGGQKIIIQATTMEAVRKVPGMSQGRIELKIDRADREAAQLLVDGLRKPEIMYENGLGA